MYAAVRPWPGLGIVIVYKIAREFPSIHAMPCWCYVTPFGTCCSLICMPILVVQGWFDLNLPPYTLLAFQPRYILG